MNDAPVKVIETRQYLLYQGNDETYTNIVLTLTEYSNGTILVYDPSFRPHPHFLIYSSAAYKEIVKWYREVYKPNK